MEKLSSICMSLKQAEKREMRKKKRKEKKEKERKKKIKRKKEKGKRKKEKEKEKRKEKREKEKRASHINFTLGPLPRSVSSEHPFSRLLKHNLVSFYGSTTRISLCHNGA